MDCVEYWDRISHVMMMKAKHNRPVIFKGGVCF